MSKKAIPSEITGIEKRPISRRDLLKVGVMSVTAATLANMPKAQAAVNPLGFCPISGLPGDTVQLFGPDFGSVASNISVKIVDGSNYAFIRPISLNGDGEVSASIISAQPAMQPGVFQVTMGEGYWSMPGNLPSQLTVTHPICTWLGNGGDRFQSFQEFDMPMSGGSSPGCYSYWGNLDFSGRLSADLIVPFNEDCCPLCPPGTRMSMRLCGATAGQAFEFEYQATLINTVELYTHQIADALCTIFLSAFNSDFGVNMDCVQSSIDETRVNISVGAPGGSPFVSGAMQLELLHGGGGIGQDSLDCDSQVPDTIAGDCDSIGPSCPSIDADFTPFIFS